MNKLILYRGVNITDEKNFKIDSIDEYLSLYDKLEFNDIQYVKNSLNTSIKVELDQSYFDVVLNHQINYAKIINNNNGKSYYYFVKDCIWTSKTCVNFVLKMDVLNTIGLQFTNKTRILREHKDRFWNPKHQQQRNFIRNIKLNDTNIWEISNTSVGLVGIGTFKIKFDEPIPTIEQTSTPFTTSISRVSGSGTFPDGYEIDYDYQTNSVSIVWEKVGQLSEIPTGSITLISETASGNYKEPIIRRKIDFQNEGINPVLFKKNEDYAYDDVIFTGTTKEESQKANSYFVYKTMNEASTDQSFIYNNPINLFYCSDYKIRGFNKDVVIEPDDIDNSHWYYITYPTGATSKKLNNSFSNDYPNPQPEMSIKVQVWKTTDTTSPSQIIELKLEKVNENRNRQKTIRFKKDGSSIRVYETQLKRDNFELSTTLITNVSKLVFKKLNYLQAYFTDSTSEESNFNWYDLLIRHGATSPSIFVGEGNEPTYSKTFSEIDNTDSKLVKIIKLPYKTTNDDSILEYNPQEQLYKINYSNKLYTNRTINVKTPENDDIKNPLNPIIANISLPISNPETQLRDDELESKLFNSEFYINKIVYDSFNYSFKLEELDQLQIYNKLTHDMNIFNFDFIVSTNATSSFLFDFKDSFPLKTSTQDYDNIMVVNRNLECPIYNNYYLNYLRNGYNQQVKSNNASKIASGVGIGLSAATLATGIVLSATGVGASVGVGAIVGGVAGIAGSLTSAITTSVNADRALAQKLEDARNQGTTINGADDIGLLSYYTGETNKPKFVVYSLSENTRKRIADLFYYCGYKCDYQDTPHTNTRIRFNYIQCEPDFVSFVRDRLSEEIKNELYNKCKTGFTVIHKFPSSGTSLTKSLWDTEQKYENFETWLYNLQN